MNRLTFVFVLLFLLSVEAFAYTIHISTYDSTRSVWHTIQYNGSAVHAFNLIQVIKASPNNEIDPPNNTTNNGAVRNPYYWLNSSFQVGDAGLYIGGGFYYVSLTGYTGFCQYAYISNSDNGIWFVTGDTICGPVHTNGYFSMQGTPVFLSTVSSHLTYSSTQPYQTSGVTNPYFAIPPVWNAPILPIPTTIQPQRDTANANGVIFDFATLYLQFNGDGTYSTRWATTGTGSIWIVHATPPNGMIYVGDPMGTGGTGFNAYVSGTVSGRYTLACQGSIHITGDLLYANDPRINPNSTDMLGLVAQMDCILENNVANTDRTIMAHILTMNSSSATNSNFYNANYTNITSGTLHLYGGLAQNHRGAVGQSGSPRTGYTKDYNYDNRFIMTSPPGYPGIPSLSPLLGSGQTYYLRCWADVPATDSLPFPPGSHYQDLGPFTMTPHNVWEIAFSPTNWNTCGSIQLSQPGNGDTVTIGAIDTIRWTAPTVISNVCIELNRNYPSGTWETLFASIPNDSQEAWTVTAPFTPNARIRITAVDYPTVGDTSGVVNIISNEPAPPANLVVTTQGEDAHLSWSRVDTSISGNPVNVERYVIYYRSTESNSWQYLWATFGADSTSFTHVSVVRFSPAMYYQVLAWNGGSTDSFDSIIRTIPIGTPMREVERILNGSMQLQKQRFEKTGNKFIK